MHANKGEDGEELVVAIAYGCQWLMSAYTLARLVLELVSFPDTPNRKASGPITAQRSDRSGLK